MQVGGRRGCWCNRPVRMRHAGAAHGSAALGRWGEEVMVRTEETGGVVPGEWGLGGVAPCLPSNIPPPRLQ